MIQANANVDNGADDYENRLFGVDDDDVNVNFDELGGSLGIAHGSKCHIAQLVFKIQDNLHL